MVLVALAAYRSEGIGRQQSNLTNQSHNPYRQRVALGGSFSQEYHRGTMYTINQVCEKLGISRSLVYREIAQENLPPIGSPSGRIVSANRTWLSMLLQEW